MGSRGYTRLSAHAQLRLMAHVSRWLAGQGLDAAALTPQRVEAFCVVRRREGYRGLRTAKALRPLEDFLQREGVLTPPARRAPASARERLLARYREYLVGERGLVDRVVSSWMQAAELLLAEYPGLPGAGCALDAAAVSAFCVRELPGRGGAAARNLAAALRSFLRFLYVDGVVSSPLAQAVPAVAIRKGAGLPAGILPATLGRLLASS